MKTYTVKAGDIEQKWYIVDAKGLVLGRLAAVLASRLRGKHKAAYTSHLDCGDHMIVINAEKVKITGKKRANKRYYRHTGYPGGLKSQFLGDMLEGRFPQRVLELAVRRMIPSGPLGRQQFKKLHVYAGEDHPHAAQKPEALDVAVLNSKNTQYASS